MFFLNKRPSIHAMASDDGSPWDGKANQADAVPHSLPKESELAKAAEQAAAAAAAAVEKRTVMQRTTSMTMRAEKEDLQEAAKESCNVIVDLTLDGNVRWVSPSWQDILGTPCETIQDKPLSDLLVEDKECFKLALDAMKDDGSRSQKIRFAVMLGPKSKLLRDPVETAIAAEEEGFRPEEVDDVNHILEMEGQGILIFDKNTGEPSHTMWVLRPWVKPKEITIDLPQPIIDSLGVGAGMLAQYLTSLTEVGVGGPENHPPPLPVLCRICERQIQPWWFEKHSELCMMEHKAESEVQLAQDNLSLQRNAIVKVLDAMEKAASYRGQTSNSGGSAPVVEYRGFSIGPPSTPQSTPGNASPDLSKPKDSPSLTGVKSKFGVRRPQVRIVELLLDLCDTALEISTPAVIPLDTDENGSRTFRTQSPGSEARVSQVLQWQSPSTNTLEQEHGLQLLCSDTEAASRAKVDAVLRHRNTIEFSERIRLEFSFLVQECIDEAVRKANEAELAIEDGYEDGDVSEAEGDEEMDNFFDTPYHGSSLAQSMMESELIEKPEDMPNDTPLEQQIEHAMMYTDSPASGGSPRPCSTPKSQRSFTRLEGRRSRLSLQSSFMSMGTDPGDSDASVQSSLAAAGVRRSNANESPISDHEGLTRSRSMNKKRHTVGFYKSGSASPNRQPSPSRPLSSASPMRAPKPRLSAIFDGHIPTPITSPLLCTGDFSPALENFHHRRQSSTTSSDHRPGPPPLSPRLTSVNPTQQRVTTTSIKDFEIIKPISKGAFGSVYLSKKRSTGDYFAIKVLKKADMIAKNQVTNVRAERAIMMVQGESDFVAKLFWTFSSKDYLFLVMEYLNGGDCAALIKAIGCLPEDWSRKYLAEVVLGVEHLHERGIVHRDLKPDNLLIDQKGHLKLTDFGLSRMGLLGRQKRALQGSSESTPDLLSTGPFVRSRSVASSRSASFDFPPANSPANTPVLTPEVNPNNAPSYFNLNREVPLSRENSIKENRRSSKHRSDSGGSESLVPMFNSFSLNDPSSYGMLAARRSGVTDDDAQSNSSASSDFGSNSNLHHTASTHSSVSQGPTSSMMPPRLALFDPEDSNRKFVGTPDYLSPETISGTGQDEMCDWWSIGCILFEFLTGCPPFHADSHDKVFDNILHRRIAWPDEDEELISPEAKDLIEKLLCMDQNKRLGIGGAQQVKDHPFFKGVDWEHVLDDEASFVPAPENPEDTEYFDSRGATLQAFAEELEDSGTSSGDTPSGELPDRPHDAVPRSKKELGLSKRGLMPLHIPPHVRDSARGRRLSEPVATDDFGTFQFKNLPVLEKANKDVIQRLRTEALKGSTVGSTASSSPSSNPSSDGSPVSAKAVTRTLSSSSRHGKRAVSPSNLHTPSTASPNRMSQPSSPLLVSFSARKASNASNSSANSGSFGGPGNAGVVNAAAGGASQSTATDAPPPKLATNFKLPTAPSSSTSSSPVKTQSISPVKSQPKLAQTPLSPRREGFSNPRRSGSTRVRSLTVGSQEGEPPAFLDSLKQYKRRSQVFDMSPSSSDNEDSRSSALLRVQRRRQSSRRMSTISLNEGPMFRPLDILVCEDHPVSRMVMERMLEKLQCRTMVVDNGGEAMRCAMSEVKFDLILTEFRLPQINGEDLSRMIKTTRNVNANTPIVAVTGYIRDLKAPHHFDELLEKPATPAKLIDVMQRLCQWKPPTEAQKVASPRSSTFPMANDAYERRPSLERTYTMPLRRPSSMILPGSVPECGNDSPWSAFPATRPSRSNSDELGKPPGSAGSMHSTHSSYSAPINHARTAHTLSGVPDDFALSRGFGIPAMSYSKPAPLGLDQRRSRLSLTSFAPNSPTSPAPPVPVKSGDRFLKPMTDAQRSEENLVSPRTAPLKPAMEPPMEKLLDESAPSQNQNEVVKSPGKQSGKSHALQPSPRIERGGFSFGRLSPAKKADTKSDTNLSLKGRLESGNIPDLPKLYGEKSSFRFFNEAAKSKDDWALPGTSEEPFNFRGPPSPQKGQKPTGNPQALTSKANRLGGGRTKSVSPENTTHNTPHGHGKGNKSAKASIFEKDKAYYLNTPPDSADDESSSSSWTRRAFKNRTAVPRNKNRSFFSDMKRAKSDESEHNK